MHDLHDLIAAIAAFQNAPERPIRGRVALSREVLRLAARPDLPKPLPDDVRSGVAAAAAYAK